MTDDRRAILWVLAGATLFASQDMLIKLFGDRLSLLQIIFFRSLLGVVLISLYYRLTGTSFRIISPFPALAITRGVLTFTGHILLFSALLRLPLVEVTALYFTYPAFIGLLAPLIVGRRTRYSEWLAIGVALFGVFLLCDVVGWADDLVMSPAHFLPIACAFCYTLVVLLTKKTAGSDTLFEQSLHVHLMAMILAIGLPVVGFFGGAYGSVSPAATLLSAPWHMSDAMAWLALLLIAASGVAAMFCLTHAYRKGQPAQLAPFEYFMIVASLIYGTLIWHDVVTPQEFIGIILIILSGIYLTRQMQ